MQNVPHGHGRRPGAGKPKGPNSLVRGIGYLNHYRKLAFFAYASLFLSTLAALTNPFITRTIISQGIQAGNDPLIINLAVLMVVVAVIGGVFTFLQGYLAENVSQGVAFDLRNELYEKIQRLSFSYHDKSRTGQLMTRATSDVEQVRVFLGQGFLVLINAVVLLIGITIILFALNGRLAAVTLPILPLALVFFAVFGTLARPLFMSIQQKLGAFNTILQENVAGFRVVKAFVRADQERQRFQAANDDLVNASLKVNRTMAFMFPVIFLISSLGQIAILGVGGNFVIQGTLGVGELVAFTSYLLLAFFPIGQLGMILTMMSSAMASADRVFEILDAKSDVTDAPDAGPLPPIQGRVEFNHVTFRYFGGGEPVLNDVSFTIEPGQVVALLGATGSGKSSIINLVPRFYDATDGQVLIDGHDVKQVCLDSLRSQIGIVLQETRLFSGTIQDNIAYGRSDASMDDVIEAAKAAAAHDFIVEFPKGYDTPVAELGASLSGGQKQRIAIARALLMEPRILILDDSTSSVDLQTEVHIQAALERLMKNRTSFVIAQRISTVQNADVIIVLDKGRVAAMGKHADLLECEPIYSEIYHSQLVEDVPATSKVQVDLEMPALAEVVR
jgi:ATP-binding cassette subfamily B multidrug efflux pump